MAIENSHKLRTTDLTFTMNILCLDPVLTNISFFSLVSSFEPVNLMLYLTNGNETFHNVFNPMAGVFITVDTVRTSPLAALLVSFLAHFVLKLIPFT